MSAIEQYNKLGQEIGSLELRETQLRNSIRQTVESLWAEQGVDGGGNYENFTSIPKRLTMVLSAKSYVHSLQELQEAAKDLERASREVSRAVKEGGAAYMEAIQAACSCFQAASIHLSKIQPIPIEIQGRHLSKLTSLILDKVNSNRRTLKQISEDYVNGQLQACDWPPALASPSDRPPEKKTGSFWERVREKGNPALMDLGTALVALTKLQQSFEGKIMQGTMLWFCSALAAPLEKKLRMHFASENSSTADISKPEWLFATAKKIIQEHAPGMHYFQGVVPMSGLDGPFDLSVEFIRCMQYCIQGILADHHVVQLESIGTSVLWLKWTEATQMFDREMMDLAGISEDSGEVLRKFRESNCLGAFCRKKEWVASWCASEAEDCIQQMDEIMSAPDAWTPAVEENSPPSQQEIWPSKCAEGVWGVVVTVIQKSKTMPGALGQAWLQQVGRKVFHEFNRRLTAMVKQVETFKQLLEPKSASKICGCICAARYFEHNLNEYDDEASVSDHAPLSVVFSKELGTFTASKRKWSMNLARTAAEQFQSDTASYRKQLEAFGAHAGIEPPAQMDISPSLVGAILRLSDACNMLASLMDAVCFSDIWKAIAMAATRFLFNDIATEAAFSKWGSYQFYYDCYALMDIFRPYTRRPHAHLRELHESCLLLTFPAETAINLQQVLSSPGEKKNLKTHLASVQIGRLTPNQALSILSRRLE
ncbi:hypothetical protein BSKO_09385 [Bryopsis sp. KO-2023]|nr:hypothetical protein BSKO_09385 [Bryopsis sp. KO-2023]